MNCEKQKKRNVGKKKKNSRKKTIPIKLKEEVWLNHFGKTYEHKCYIDWCHNQINVFNFEAGHDVPESKGGTIDLYNLYPICSKCNKSMGDRYTIVSETTGLKDMDGIWNNFKTTPEVEMEDVEEKGHNCFNCF